MVDRILREFQKEKKADSENRERHQLIKVVGKIIRSEIRSITTRKDSYKFLNEISSVEKCLNFVCPSLCLLLSSIGVDTPCLISSIGQATMQSCRPRGLMSPAQIGLASQLHLHFSSRFLMDTLHNLSFCSSYSEVKKKIEKCAAVNQTLLEESEEKAHFFQYVGDSVDHDIATIDGLNTFHGVELIEVFTPELPATELSVPRKEWSGDEMKSIGTVPFYTYQKPTKSQPITFVCLTNRGDSHDNEWKGETLWRISGFFKRTHTWAGRSLCGQYTKATSTGKVEY